jgi:hypothetical protein
MTVEAILSEVRQLAPDERARLQAALLQEQHDGTDDYLPVAPEVRQMLRGKTGADFTAAPRYSRDETLAWLDALLHEAADPEAEAEGADWDSEPLCTSSTLADDYGVRRGCSVVTHRCISCQ